MGTEHSKKHVTDLKIKGELDNFFAQDAHQGRKSYNELKLINDTFRDQIFHSRCIESIKKFDLNKPQLEQPDTYKWIQLSDYLKQDWHLGKDVILSKIKNKNLGLCYLYAVLMFLSTKEKHLKEQILGNQIQNDLGVYSIFLYEGGCEQKEIMVDTLVLSKQITKFQYQPYVDSLDEDNIWVFLIAKAWCKYIYSYHYSQYMNVEECYQIIFGMPSLGIQLRQESKNQVLEICQNIEQLLENQEEQFLLVLNSQKIHQNELLQQNHAFIVEDVKEGKLHIRNTNDDYTGKKSIIIAAQNLLESFDYLSICYYNQKLKMKSYTYETKINETQIEQQYYLRQYYHGTTKVALRVSFTNKRIMQLQRGADKYKYGKVKIDLLKQPWSENSANNHSDLNGPYVLTQTYETNELTNPFYFKYNNEKQLTPFFQLKMGTYVFIISVYDYHGKCFITFFSTGSQILDSLIQKK